MDSDFQRSTNAVDPGPWLVIGFTVVCLTVMILVVPVVTSMGRRKHLTLEGPSLRDVLAFDDETRAILRLVGPYTLSQISDQFFSNCVLVLVAQFLGTRPVAAYALVHILLELSRGILMGPIFACITLASHAVGADNHFLSGQYMQLAVLLYLAMNVPAIYYWSNYMRQTILWLHWGDDETAILANDFARYIVWHFLIKGITMSITILWSITEHAFAKSMLEVSMGGTTVVVLFVLLLMIPDEDATLQLVGFVYSAMSGLFLTIAVSVSLYKGWLRPFYGGLFQEFAVVDNFPALQLLISTTIPLSSGEVMGTGLWAVLTYFASFLGPAEVAAWAILGNIWDLFYFISEGVGEAAEIRISLHLGDNRPALAQLSTYKSLAVGLLVAICVSSLFFALQDVIPHWFTPDPTIQGLLRELVPIIGVANLPTMLGMNCWFVLGAQGKFGLASFITALSTCTIGVSLSAIFVIVCHLDLQGLAVALATGYVVAGACLFSVTILTDWPAVALKISTENKEEEDEEEAGTLTSETSPLLG